MRHSLILLPPPVYQFYFFNLPVNYPDTGGFHDGLISEFFLKTMSYRPDNRKVRLEKQSVVALSKKLDETLEGKKFDEVLEIFFKYPVQLLAFVKADGKIVLNPKSNSDAATAVLENDDSLFIFVEPEERVA
uniref:Uncharacterized protein n=1 Tax=Candidatus Kentrum sp. LPFa TaxID=2126335 RepID=A0A450WLD9_9GAMM|nr:MAG: hypothetical protein BECKLPF1236B_GA0070989_11271 [Candidatus Kentron sp. LPFa]